MSTLQIGLAMAGGLVLAGVVFHAAWAARKNAPKLAKPQSPVSPETASAVASNGALQERQEPVFDTSNDIGLTSLMDTHHVEKKPSLDALIDVIAPIALDQPVSGSLALAALPATRRVGSKPFAVEGMNETTKLWEAPSTGERYCAFQAGVQLVNRTGALNSIEYSEFVIKTQAFADAVLGEPDFPEMHDEIARARELDQFASSHDAQLSFTLRALQTAWSPGYLQQMAARSGFVAGAMPGRMVLPAKQAGYAPVVSLVFDARAAMAEEPEQTALRLCKLSLDVPHVIRSEEPFARMCQAAIDLASSMGGVIEDEQGVPINASTMEAIHADLERLYDALDERDLSAGSVVGRRLFS